MKDFPALIAESILRTDDMVCLIYAFVDGIKDPQDRYEVITRIASVSLTLLRDDVSRKVAEPLF
jgi:hypothetical protein